MGELKSPYNSFYAEAPPESTIHILLLTDCSNAYHACAQSSCNGDCRVAKIHLPFARCPMGLLNLPTYVRDTIFRIAAQSLKEMHICSIELYGNSFIISFLSRQEFRRWTTATNHSHGPATIEEEKEKAPIEIDAILNAFVNRGSFLSPLGMVGAMINIAYLFMGFQLHMFCRHLFQGNRKIMVMERSCG